MIVTAFSIKGYDKTFLEAATSKAHVKGIQWRWHEEPLRAETSRLASGSDAVCCFVNDSLDSSCIEALADLGVKLICLRCAGYNHVDLRASRKRNLLVVRVPKYSPHAVAEHTVGLMLMLNRHLHKAYNRIREGNFSLHGLMGFDLYKQTVGLIGTGQIGACVAKILLGFGCRVIAHDITENASLVDEGVTYTTLSGVLKQSKIISLHCPLSDATHHLINSASVSEMQNGVMLINTSRGALIDTKAIIDGLKQGTVGSLGLDVYEEEAGLFFEDKSSSIIQDDTFMRLLTFPNVVVTGHQAYFTREAMEAIASQTVRNLCNFLEQKPLEALVQIR